VSVPAPACVLVVGTGLVGTSAALALRRAGVRVHLADVDPAAVALAADLGAGSLAPPDDPDVVLLAVPPSAVPDAAAAALDAYPGAAVSDVASVKGAVARAVAARTPAARRFVGGHPLAGRERGGAASARADLFEGRPWVLCPEPGTDPTALAVVTALVTACGAQPVVSMDPDRHDLAVALVSHTPQVLASLLAARLVDAPPDLLALSGQGLRDTTRIAASDPGLWSDILATNADALLPVLDALAGDLDRVRAALASSDGSAQASLAAAVAAGNAGHARIPGKHGSLPAPYTVVPVVLDDSPGQLGRLFDAVGRAGVNVEDVRMEHAPGRPMGLVELAVRPGSADTLVAALSGDGFRVHPPEQRPSGG